MFNPPAETPLNRHGQEMELATRSMPVISRQSVRLSIADVEVAEARLFSGDVLLSIMKPARSDDGTYDCDFFNGSAFHVGLAPATFIEVTYFDDSVFPRLQISEETLTIFGAHRELVCVNTLNGPVKMTLCYNRDCIGYEKI